jgi:drug/metabolite transporter (DMT)-like permease
MPPAVLAVPLSLLVEQPWNLAPSAASLGAIAVLAVWSTALAYLVFFRLVASGGATFVSLNNYLIPLVGLAWGALALGEGIGGRQIAALGLVLLGIFVTNDQLRRRLIGSD